MLQCLKYMVEFLPEAMLHRPVIDVAWRSGVIQTVLDNFPGDGHKHLLPHRANFALPLTRKDEAARLARTMKKEDMSVDDLERLLADIPGITEDMDVTVSNVWFTGRGRSSRLLARTDPQPQLAEEWEMTKAILNSFSLKNPVITNTAPPAGHFVVAQTRQRSNMFIKATDELNSERGGLAQGAQVKVSGMRIGTSPEIIDSVADSFEQSLRRLRDADNQVSQIVLDAWSNRLGLRKQEVEVIIDRLERSGQLVVEIGHRAVSYRPIFS